MPARTIELGALNIAADPHPPGTYEALLKAAAGKEIRLARYDRAKIKEPEVSKTLDGVLWGQILVWTPIDREGSWLNTETDSELSEKEKENLNLPNNAEPNLRVFYYGFNLKKHLMVLEYKNDQGNTFGPRTAEIFFSRLFSRDILGEGFPEVSVTVVPEDDSLDKILQMPHLRVLEIMLIRPNPDDITDDQERILNKLISEGAKSQDLKLVKAPGIPSLTPSEDTVTLARVAATNGYVRGVGKRADGSKEDDSTKMHPKRKIIQIDGMGASIAKFINSIRLF